MGSKINKSKRLSKANKKESFKAVRFSKLKILVFALVFAAIGGYALTQVFAGTTCLVSNRLQWALAGTDCNANTTLTFTNQTFTCNQPISSYGTPPVRIVSNWTQSVPNNNAIEFINGCVGDGSSDTIDFIFDINGVNGRSGASGAGQDSAKFRTQPGPLNLQVTGNADCGNPPAGAHQDAWQFQTGSADRNLWIVNGTSGNWSAGTATCQGAGGGPFWSSGSGIHIVGGEYVECNHALFAGGASGINRVIDAKFRTGRVESVATGGDPNCVGYSASNPCLATANLTTYQNVDCEQWNASTNTWVDAGSGNGTGASPPPSSPPSSPSPQSPSPSPSPSSGGSSSSPSGSNSYTSSSNPSSNTTGTSGSQASKPTENPSIKKAKQQVAAQESEARKEAAQGYLLIIVLMVAAIAAFAWLVFRKRINNLLSRIFRN